MRKVCVSITTTTSATSSSSSSGGSGQWALVVREPDRQTHTALMGDNSSTQSLSPGLCIVVIDLFMYYSQDLATNSLETIYFAPGGGGAKYCHQPVCLSVCVSGRLSQKPHVQISSDFLHMLPVAVARSSADGNAVCYVLPVLCRIKDDVYVSSSSPGGSTGDEVCRLWLHLVIKVAGCSYFYAVRCNIFLRM